MNELKWIIQIATATLTVLALIGISMPVFWLGIVARYYLAEGGWVTLFLWRGSPATPRCTVS